MNKIIRFCLCIAVNFLGVVESLLVVLHVLTTGVKRLLEKGAKMLIIFLALFGVMYLISLRFDNGNIVSKTWQDYITIMVTIVLVCAVLFVRSIGESLLLLLSGFVGLFIPTKLISNINLLVEKLADRYVLLAKDKTCSNKCLFAVQTLLYRITQMLKIPLNVLCFLAPIAICAIVAYLIGFVWSAPPDKLTAEWFLCVGLIVLFAGVGAYIGFNFVNTLKMYYVPEVDENEDP